mmetsp:Transcript_2877/g.9327  ORF Transcript_2877/g.9327 Transcript_2877/m.9327 type:complete len:207 (+) Transcript_2877:101-721(+)
MSSLGRWTKGSKREMDSHRRNHTDPQADPTREIEAGVPENRSQKKQSAPQNPETPTDPWVFGYGKTPWETASETLSGKPRSGVCFIQECEDPEGLSEHHPCAAAEHENFRTTVTRTCMWHTWHMRLFTLTASAAATSTASYACSFAATAASACATAPFSAATMLSPACGRSAACADGTPCSSIFAAAAPLACAMASFCAATTASPA